MTTALPILLYLLALPDVIETKFEQVHPLPKVKEIAERSPGQTRAVLLVSGLLYHPISKSKVHQALLHDWQKPACHLVAALGKHADVYAFAYSQNVPLESICQHPALANSVQRLKALGYEEIILLGHSAGGVMARMFVEDNPEAGVARVIQVCTPNKGSSWAKTDIRTKDQEPFLHSLTKEERLKCCQKRADKKIPPNVEFLCVIAEAANLGGDFLVSKSSQWPDDLRKQGIPAVLINTNHFLALRLQKNAEKIAELAVQNHPRWSEEQMVARRKVILDKATD